MSLLRRTLHFKFRALNGTLRYIRNLKIIKRQVHRDTSKIDNQRYQSIPPAV